MRNISAERALVEKTFLFAGTCTMLGILVLALGTEVWLIVNVLPMDWTLFLVLQGVWLVLLGLTLATVASLVQKNQRP